MTSTASPPPATPAPPTFVSPSSGPRRSGGRRAAIAIGAVIALFGAVLALAGGALLAVFGFDGVAATGRHELSTTTSALTSGTASIDTGGVVDDLGGTRVTISARADGGRPVFVGIARAADVDRYLAGAATDEITDFNAGPFESSFDVERVRHAGTAVPEAPGDQSFWVARASGTTSADVDWKVRDGDYRVVVMNADGSRGVATQTKLGVDVPYVPGIAVGILAAGLIVAGGGIVAIVLGARRPRA